jgi:hypothetical protein
MRGLIPFGDCVDDHRGIDQSCDYASEQDDENEIAERPGQAESAKGENVD